MLNHFNGLEIYLQIKLHLKKLLNTFLLFIFCFLLLTCCCTFPCRQKRRRWSFPHGCDAYTFQTGQKKEDNVVHGGSRWWARKRNIYIGSSDTWWPGKIKNLGRKFYNNWHAGGLKKGFFTGDNTAASSPSPIWPCKWRWRAQSQRQH